MIDRVEYEGVEKDLDQVISSANHLKTELQTIEKYEAGARRGATRRLAKEVTAVPINDKGRRALLW